MVGQHGKQNTAFLDRLGRKARQAAGGLALLALGATAAARAEDPVKGYAAAQTNESPGMLSELVEEMRGRVWRTSDFKWGWSIGWFELNPNTGDLYKFVMQNEEWPQASIPAHRMTGYAVFNLCDPQLLLYVDGSCTHAVPGVDIETMVLHAKDRPLAGFINNIRQHTPGAKYHTVAQPEDRAWLLKEWGIDGPDIDWMAPGMTGRRGQAYWDLEELVPVLGVDRDPFSIYTAESLCFGDRKDPECAAANNRLYEIVAYHVWPDRDGPFVIGDADPVLIGRLNYQTGELRRVHADQRYVDFWKTATPPFGPGNFAWYTKIHLGGRDESGFENKQFGIDTERQEVAFLDMRLLEGVDNCVK